MKLTTIGIDLAKNVFQVHGIDVHGKVLVKKQLRRDQMAAFFVVLPPCLIGMATVLCAVNAMPTLTGMPELAMSVAERCRMPCVPTCAAPAALSVRVQPP